MPVLTRKRKAELEATEEKTQIDAQLETEQQHAEAPRMKRQKQISPFRPLSPPPRTIWRHKSRVRYPTVKNPTTKPQNPIPIIFFTIPEATTTRQVSAKSRSSNDVDIILATKSLFEHTDIADWYHNSESSMAKKNLVVIFSYRSSSLNCMWKENALWVKHGAEAMPNHEDLKSWLEENKHEFIQARKDQTRRQPTQPSQFLGSHDGGAAVAAPAAPTAAGVVADGAIAPSPETPVARHLVVRPRVDQLRGPRADGGIFRRVVRYARHSTARLLSRVAAALEGPVSEDGDHIPQTEQHQPHLGGNQEQCREEAVVNLDEDSRSRVRAGPEVAVTREHTWIRPVAPPLDARFFHPNGQLQSVYKYLTAQIPLPRPWVQWAIHNGITNVPGRGDVREPGVYVAEDTFDYDALYQVIHRGSFRTGRMEIDYFPEHWPFVEGQRDSMVADLELHPFSTTPTEEFRQRRSKSAAPSPEPSHVEPAAESDNVKDDLKPEAKDEDEGKDEAKIRAKDKDNK
ncbi:hypothetical protein M434DRAFT_27629 [Hypoxylon sp. CO27-5]|nr:hypothetical protein M434DRAFT_27629 [Hypoxylon sp. CO27-5]